MIREYRCLVDAAAHLETVIQMEEEKIRGSRIS